MFGSGAGELTSLLASLSGETKKKKKTGAGDKTLKSVFVPHGAPLQPVAVQLPSAQVEKVSQQKADRKLKRSLKRKAERAVREENPSDDDDDNGDGSTGASAGASAAVGSSSGDGRPKSTESRADKAASNKKAKPGKGKEARVLTPEEQERLERTVFIGNLSAALTRRQIQRALNRFLNGARESLDDLVLPSKAGGAGDDQGEEEEEAVPEDTGDFGGVDTAFVPGRDVKSPVESVRLRSVPIKGVSVESGASYKSMRKAATILGEIDHGGHDTMNAYVVMRSVKEAERALALNSKVLAGRHLRVNMANTKDSHFDHNLSVFVGNLPFTAKEESVRTAFAAVVSGGDDSIVNVRLIRDRAKNVGKGFGYVAFKDREHVFQALAATGLKFESRELRITQCQSEEKQQRAKDTVHHGVHATVTKVAGALRRLHKKSASEKVRDAAKQKRAKTAERGVKKALRKQQKKGK